METALLRLVTQLEAAMPLYSLEDVEAPEPSLWPAVIYSSLGVGLLLCCCLCGFFLASARKKRVG